MSALTLETPNSNSLVFRGMSPLVGGPRLVLGAIGGTVSSSSSDVATGNDLRRVGEVGEPLVNCAPAPEDLGGRRVSSLYETWWSASPHRKKSDSDSEGRPVLVDARVVANGDGVVASILGWGRRMIVSELDE